jgi:hypothetical protein
MTGTLRWIGLALLLAAPVVRAEEATPPAEAKPAADATPPAEAKPAADAKPPADAKGAKPAAGKAAEAKAAAASAADEKIATQLKAFCIKWMGFLEKRESDNRKAAKYTPRATGVGAQYVGYSKEYDCIMKERSSNGTPVAVIVYRELIYEQVGATQGEAEQSTPAVVDMTEVTEIFRHAKGDWVY